MDNIKNINMAIKGLTDVEIKKRIDEGLVNKADISTGKTIKEIIVSNIFTYFNLIFIIITMLLIMVGSFRNLTFLPIIIGNTLIGTVQELRAQKTLEKMSLLNVPHADVVRDGKLQQVSIEELVKRKVLLHDMKSIETLARVDVLCVNKTGTITEPDMKVKDVFLCKDSRNILHTEEELKSLLMDYANASKDNNATMLALKEYATNTGNGKNENKNRTEIEQQAFSSSLKYGSIKFSDGIYVLGAPEFIMREDFSCIESEILPYTENGDRVLMFAKYEGDSTKNGLTEGIIPLGFTALANPIRENAEKTFFHC